MPWQRRKHPERNNFLNSFHTTTPFQYTNKNDATICVVAAGALLLESRYFEELRQTNFFQKMVPDLSIYHAWVISMYKVINSEIIL